MKADHSMGSIFRFLLVSVALIVPFWVIGGVSGLQLLPGLPLAGLGALCPGAAAAIVVHREGGWRAVTGLVRRSIHLDAKRWLVPTLLLMPVVSALSFAALRLSGVPVPAPQVELTPALILCAASFVGAVGEEVGWSGYAIDPMQARWGAPRASVVMGAIWALYHYIALVQAHRALPWIAWWTVGNLALRVLIVWLYNHSGRSVLVAVIVHMTINVTWQLFPVNGSYYDPAVTGSILALVAAIAVAGWGPRKSTRSQKLRTIARCPEQPGAGSRESDPHRLVGDRFVQRVGGDEQAQVDRGDHSFDQLGGFRSGRELATLYGARDDRLDSTQPILEEAALEPGELRRAGQVRERCGHHGPAGGARQPADQRAGVRAQVRLDGVSVRDRHVDRDLLYDGIEQKSVTVLPSPVDRRLVDSRTPRDVVDGQRGVPDLGQLAECGGEHGSPDARSPAELAGPVAAAIRHRNSPLRYAGFMWHHHRMQLAVAMEEGR